MPREDGQFQPGQSGNPNGRPVGTRNRSTIVRKVLEMENVLPDDVYNKLKVQFPQIEKQMTVEEVMVIVMVNKAVTKGGNVQAFTALMDSAYGRMLDQSLSNGTFEDTTPEELDNQFYLPEPEDVEDVGHEDVQDSA